MSVSIFRFSLSMSVALIALVAVSGVTVAQDVKPRSQAAKNELPRKTQWTVRIQNPRRVLQRDLVEKQRDLVEKNIREGLERAYNSIPVQQNLSFDWVPSEEVDGALISNYWIGVQCSNAGSTTFSPKEASGAELTVSGGMKILAVTEGGAAEASGLKEGDVLLKFAGKDMASLNDLYAAIGETKDSEASMLVVRDRGLVSMKITPQERPQETEEAASSEVEDPEMKLQKIGLRSLEDAMEQEIEAKQLPEGYRLQFELVRGKDVKLKVTNGDDVWRADSDSIGNLPEPVQAAASSIFVQCEPMVALNPNFLWLEAWHAATVPTARYAHLSPLVVSGNDNNQLADLRKEIQQLAEAVKKLGEKLED